MERPILESTRLLYRAQWLVKLRWIFIGGILATTFLIQNVFDIPLGYTYLYILPIVLVMVNLVSTYALKKSKFKVRASITPVKMIIDFQIISDLIILTFLLHFAGGLENPLFLYLLFHVVIAGSLLSKRNAYLKACFSILLICLLAILEYTEIVPHYCLEGIFTADLHNNLFYILVVVIVYASTSLMVVYLTTSIAFHLRQQQMAYQLTNKELLLKDKLKNEYVLRLTHDIKGHLSAIQMNLSVVSNKYYPLNENDIKFVDNAYRRVIKLTLFVKDLLRLTRIKVSNQFDREIFPIKEVISHILDSIKADADQKKIAVKYNINSGVDTVYGDRIAIEEVLLNLLNNAVYYSEESGRVSIKVFNEDNKNRFEILDTGLGIPGNEQQKIFDEFYRASNVRKIYRDGSGLGLAIVKQIVEKHHGEIWVESKPGMGSKFIFTLPGKNNKTNKT